nr:hypothetical protein [uncultured Draconibacterium sp.]
MEHNEPDGVLIHTSTDVYESCPICDYHFPVNELPRLLFFKPGTQIVQHSLPETKIKQACKQVVSTKTPRAPPAIT